MTVSVVLRLTLPALREGRLAGQVTIVEDGTRLMVRDAEELLLAVRQHLGERVGALPPGGPEAAGSDPVESSSG